MTLAGLTLSEIIGAIGGKVLFGKPDGVGGISIDSRNIAKGDIFLALKGERFDGHDFVSEALKVASGAIVSVPPASPPADKCIIHVQNTLKALQDMAKYMRRKYNPVVVGITGTNGKTTTKEMASSILSTRYSVLKNTGNLNNQIGLPLSMLELDPSHEAAVLEMGASAPGDIRELCEIAEPAYGVLTNIGHAHIEGFKDIGIVRKAKMELLDSVGAVAVNADDAFLMEGLQSYGGRIVRFGIDADCDVRATDIELGVGRSAFMLDMNGETGRVEINVSGLFNVYNALAAASVAHMLDLDISAVRHGLGEFSGIPMRVEIKEFHGAMVISDVYNANPASMEEALKELVRLRGKRAIAVLGDMLELGSYSDAAHRRLGEWMSRFPIDIFIAVGPGMALAAEEFQKSGKTAVKSPDSATARQVLASHAGDGDTVLVKGSRTMRMEMVLDSGANGRAEVKV